MQKEGKRGKNKSRNILKVYENSLYMLVLFCSGNYTECTCVGSLLSFLHLGLCIEFLTWTKSITSLLFLYSLQENYIVFYYCLCYTFSVCAWRMGYIFP